MRCQSIRSPEGLSLFFIVNRLVTGATVLKLVVMLALTSLSLFSAAADNTDTVASPVLTWRTLELQNSGVTGSVATRIELSKYTAAEVQSTLLDVPQLISQRQAGTRILELEVASSIRLLLGAGIENQSRLWFNEDNGLPLQLMRLRQGSKPSQKLYRFGSRQVYRQRRLPADKAETGQPADQWSKVSDSFYPLEAEHDCPVILESSQLLYLLSRSDTVPGDDGGVLCVFDRQRVYQVEFRVQGREQHDVNYLQLDAGQETRVKRTLQVLHVTLSGRPLDSVQADVQPFSFLGLQGDIQLLLSDPGRIPLRVHGRVTGFGMIDLELVELTR